MFGGNNMKKITAVLLFAFGFSVYAQEHNHEEHKMSPQVHRCMKVMEEPEYMTEMFTYMLQNKEAMKEMLNKNPDLKKQLEDLVKQ
jgi:hypothetical protein